MQSPSVTSAQTSRLAKGIQTSQQALTSRLFAPTHVASLIYFRVAFGLIMLWEVWRYFNYGWIARYWIEPDFHFTYYGFDWVKPWPGQGMFIHFVVLGVLAFFITVGLWYRLSAILFFLGFTYMFLLEQAQYLNHFYLVCLVSFVLIFLPCHQVASFDAWIRPQTRRRYVPAWTLWLLRFQIAVPYFFGGVAKLNADWLHGSPLQQWLATRTDFPLIGPYFTEEWMVFGFSYGGLLLDLFVVPFLLWSKTRPFAFITAVIFHLINARLFSIGIFPWFMIAATLMFFEPDWPHRIWRWFKASLQMVWHSTQLNWRLFKEVVQANPVEKPVTALPAGSLSRKQQITVLLLAIYVIAQLLIPLRHFLIPGNVSWTEEGHRFAWHMKLRGKSADILFTVTDPARGETWDVNPGIYLTDRQVRKMSTRPYMILQFAHFLAQEMDRAGFEDVEVRSTVTASLNGRPPQLLIDPTVDLAAQPRTPWPVSWIVPLRK